MNLGKCPICRENVEVFRSLKIDDFERYDLKCETKGCLIQFKEFQYEDRSKLIQIFRESQELAGVRPDKKVRPVNNKLTKSQERSVDFLDKKKRPRKVKSKSHKVTITGHTQNGSILPVGIHLKKKKVKEPVMHYNRNEKGICGHKGRLTEDIKDVTCGNCLNNRNLKLKFGL